MGTRGLARSLIAGHTERMFTVTSTGPIGPTTDNLRTVADVDIYVAQLEAKGHEDIMVTAGDTEPEPYEAWRAFLPGPRAQGFDG